MATDPLAVATAVAQEAYRDTTRLLRLLSVLGQPGTPDQLAEETLAVLSEVFFAEVTALTHRHGHRLVVTSSCGLPESDPGFVDGWPIGPAAAQAMAAGAPAARHGELHPHDQPEPWDRLGIGSAAWIPLSNQPGYPNLLTVLRHSSRPFDPSDLHVLVSVAARLRLAVEEGERQAVVERLVRYGHQLARHIDLDPLLDEAVALLRRLTDAEATWLATIEGDRADLRAHRGLSDQDLVGWPRTMGQRAHHRVAIESVSPADNRDGAIPAGRTGSILRVPVVRDGRAVALLFAQRGYARPFSWEVAETMAIFASYLGVAMDNAALYRRLHRQATHDPLTGLANRVLVSQRLEDALGRDEPTGVGLLFCDLDGFKAVNDRLGHEAGDELLHEVARRLQRRVPRAHLLARFGGDEFVVVLDGVRELGDITAVGRQISRGLDDPFLVRGEPVQVSASIGGVLGVRGKATASSMLRDADAALYTAKERGVGQVEVFDEVASHRSLDRLQLRADLSHAVARAQLHLRYQPVMALDTGRVVGFEALVRWTHPRHGPVSPEVFIPLAEETGVITTIGTWVMAQACQQLAQWRHQGMAAGIRMGVNFSAVQLRQPHLVPQTVTTIREAGVEPSDLCLEITEHSYRRSDVSAFAARLRAVGVHFALDDFGTGYASLADFKRFPIETVKIDRSFVAGISERDLDLSLVKAVLAFGESMGVSVIAEGIETERQRATLIALGCPFGQGYALSAPLTAVEATEFLRAAEQDPGSAGATRHLLSS